MRVSNKGNVINRREFGLTLLVDPVNGVYEADFLVLRDTKIPAVIVESGVITNPYEEAKLRDPQAQTRIATAIDRAVTRYFNELQVNKNIKLFNGKIKCEVLSLKYLIKCLLTLVRDFVQNCASNFQEFYKNYSHFVPNVL